MFEPKAMITGGYEAFDLTPPVIPARSRLYNLEPIGVGTTYVESLSSYIVRLADAHSVTAESLFAFEIVPLVNRSYLSNIKPELGMWVFQGVSHGLNGKGPIATDWVAALESLTLRDDLRYLTMLTWKHLLSSKILLRKNRVWCSDCYDEQQKNNSHVYDQLLWALRDVTACPRHIKKLEERCPHCGKQLHPFSRKMRAGFCNSCQGWLGTTSENEASRGTESEEALSECVSTTLMIGDMLAVAPFLQSSMSKEHSALAFSKNTNRLPPYSLKTLARITGVGANVMSNLMRGNHKIRLSILIRASKAFGLSIPDFLNGKDADASAPIWTISPRLRTRTQLTSLLEVALHDPTCPSVAELSRQLGYKSPNSLRAASPELCKKITARNKENVSSNHKKSGTNYQLDHVGVILSEALREEPPPTVKEVSVRAGYGSEVLFRGVYQDITKSLMERRAEYLKTENSVIEGSLYSALKEEPPPSLEEVCSRLRYKGKPFSSTKYLMVKFRSLGHAIRARHAAFKAIEDERKRRAIFEAALVEEPPPCVRDLISRMNCTRRTLYKKFPSECKQVASRYLQHHKGKLRKKKDNHLTL